MWIKNKKDKAMIIAIVGAPRSGKSFLARKLATYFDAELFLEGEEADFPDRIKEDIKQGVRPLERILWFRNKLVEKQLKAQTTKNSGKHVVMDTFWMSVEPYIPILLKDEFEQNIFKDAMELDKMLLGSPDLLILLENSIENSKKFLALGNRDFDSGDSYVEEYIIPNKEMHIKTFTKETIKGKFLILDRTELDFTKESDFNLALEKIKEALL